MLNKFKIVSLCNNNDYLVLYILLYYYFGVLYVTIIRFDNAKFIRNDKADNDINKRSTA